MGYRFKTATPPTSPIGHAIIRDYTTRNKKHIDAGVDSLVRYCKQCTRCWQPMKVWDKATGRHTKKVSEHYIDFPSIGKKRQICYTCKEDHNG